MEEHIKRDFKILESLREKLAYISHAYPDLSWRFKGIIQNLDWLIKTFRETYPKLSK